MTVADDIVAAWRDRTDQEGINKELSDHSLDGSPQKVHEWSIVTSGNYRAPDMWTRIGRKLHKPEEVVRWLAIQGTIGAGKSTVMHVHAVMASLKNKLAVSNTFSEHNLRRVSGSKIRTPSGNSGVSLKYVCFTSKWSSPCSTRATPMARLVSRLQSPAEYAVFAHPSEGRLFGLAPLAHLS